ncbi:hypothetical protein V8F06_004832 [Rhypophila decipiens]
MHLSKTLLSSLAVAVNLGSAVAGPIANEKPSKLGSASAPTTSHVSPPPTGETSVILGEILPERPANLTGPKIDIVITAATLDSNKETEENLATRSFRNSCDDCKIERGYDLYCFCKGADPFVWNWTHLFLGHCLENIDGGLRWKRNGWYTRSCATDTGRWDNGIFRISCNARYGRPISTSIDLCKSLYNKSRFCLGICN